MQLQYFYNAMHTFLKITKFKNGVRVIFKGNSFLLTIEAEFSRENKDSV